VPTATGLSECRVRERSRIRRGSETCFIPTMAQPDRPNRIALGAARLGPVWLILLIGGFYGGALGWRGGAVLMLAAVCGMISGHLLMGVTEYRRTMRRPWPKVPPLDDDDDW
jgi:membrane associated rhomboid family serine protease